VDVEQRQIFAFALREGGSWRIQRSQVFPDLDLAILEAVLQKASNQNDSEILADLMQQFQIE
jgi:hypothetical protein